MTAAFLPIARAQSIVGAFAPFDDAYYFRDPNLILPDNIGVVPVSGATSVLIDRNGDGRLNQSNPAFPLDPVMPLPVEARGAANYFLSPTRTFLLVRGLAMPGSCIGFRIQIYRVPPTGTTLALVHDACLPGGLNNGNGKWYDTGLCNRNLLTGQCTSPGGAGLGTNAEGLFVALTTTGAGVPRVVWMDLNDMTPAGNDGQAATDFAGPANGIGQMTVALAGNFAFVQSDIQGGMSDFSVVDICPASPSFGDVVLGPPAYNNVSDFLTAAVTQVSGGSVTISTFASGSPFGPGTVRPDCPSSPPPPPTGACCVNGVCTPAVTSAACAGMGGTWSAGLGCSPNPCPQPAPQLSVSMTGPVSAVRGSPITYTLTYRNLGGAAATNVVLRNVLPSGTTFISATGGGTLASSTVTWSLGTVPAMSSAQSVMLTLRSPCSGTSVVNSNYTITGDGLGTVNGSPVVNSMLTAPATAPITMTLSSVPARLPLQGGDVVTHTIEMVNTIAANRPDLQIQFIQAGQSASIGTVLDAAGGIVTTQGTGSLSWAGSLAPLATATLVFTTRVNDCIGEGDSDTQLNHGQQVTLRNACFTQLGAAVPPGPFALLKPISAELRVTNTSPGQIGPVAPGSPIGAGIVYQAVRDGAALEFAVEIRNHLPHDVADAGATVPIPAEINLPPMPLIAPVPAGASFDPDTRTVSYLGPIAAGSSVLIRLSGTLNAAGQCRVGVSAVAGTGAACRNVRSDLSLLVVPPVPAGRHLIAAHIFRGLLIFDPAADTAFRDLLCAFGEIYTGIGRAPNGDLVVVGLPNFVFNPVTLDLRFFDAHLEAAGLALPADGAIDPADGTVILTGVGPNSSGSQVVRLDPVNGAVTVLVSDPSLQDTGSVVVDADGSVVFIAASGPPRRIVDPRTGPFPIAVAALTPIALPAADYSDAFAAGAFVSTHLERLVQTPTGDYAALATTDFLVGNIYTSANALYDIERATGTATLVHRAISAAAYSLSTGNPTFINPALGALAFSESNNDAIGRASDRYYMAPTGTQNTALTVVDTTVNPPAIAGVFVHLPFGATDMVVVEPTGPAPCPPDINGDGSLDPDDLSDFITCFFTMPPCPMADYNGIDGVDADDLSDYVTAFFTGCP